MKKNYLIKVSGLLLLSALTLSIADAQSQEKTIGPGNNFYTFVNEKWIQSSKIPDDMPAWGGFPTLGQENEIKLRSILEELAKNPHLTMGSAEQRVGDFYASAMDTAAINKLGYKPLLPVLTQLVYFAPKNR